jgi:hypothetical protein
MKTSVCACILLKVIASDGGTPPQVGSATVTVIVDAYVDMSPVFAKNSDHVTMQRSLPVNVNFYAVRATINDTTGSVLLLPLSSWFFFKMAFAVYHF